MRTSQLALFSDVLISLNLLLHGTNTKIMDYNANGSQQPPPAEVQQEMEPPPASVVKMSGYKFLDAALRDSLPNCWSNDVGKAESITLDSPTSPRYTGVVNDGHCLEGSVRSEIRIPAKLLAYYYEVTTKDRTIAIGFGRSHKNMKCLPGWQEDERAFHLDEGAFYYGDRTYREQYHNGSPIEDGAVYGCGVDFSKNEMFFTKNGIIIASKPPVRKMTFGKGNLYPVVGLWGMNTQIDTNFGERAFNFDLESYYNALVQRKKKKQAYRSQYEVNRSILRGRLPRRTIGHLRQVSLPRLPHTAYKRSQLMVEENPGPSKIPRRNPFVNLPNLDEPLDAENSEHVPRVRNDVQPRVSISLENFQEIETGRYITLGEIEHSQTNATSNVADVDPNLPHCEPDEAEIDNDVVVVGEIVNNARSRANNHSQVKNEVRFAKPEILKGDEMRAQNPGPNNIFLSHAEVSERVHLVGNYVKSRVRISLENAQQIETGRDVTLGENEHSQTNAMSNVADVDPSLPHCEPDEAELDNYIEVVGEIVNDAVSRANNQSQAKNEPEILEADESNGPSNGFDINEILDLISRGNAQEAEAKIIASEFGPIYESDPELVLFLKIEVLVELWKGNEETDADVRKIHLLGKSISSLAHGIPSLGAGIQQKVEDSLLLSYSVRNQELEQHKYLLRPVEHQKVANLIGVAFTAYKAKKDYQNLKKSF